MKREQSCQVNSTIQNIETSSKEFLLDDVVINLRMRTDYSAKSYHPDDFIGIIDGEDVGSKKWTKTEVNKKGEEKTKIGKEVFIKVKKNSLQALEQKLIHGSGFTKEFIQELKRVTGNYTLEKYYKSLARIARNISPAERKTILNILEIVANQNMEELDTSLLL